MAPRGGKEHDVHDTIRMYKDTIREDAIELGDPYDRAPTQQKLKIAERVVAYSACDMDKVARLDDRDAKTSQVEILSSQSS